MSRQQQLMEMVVGNFLNIFAVSAIIILLIILTLGFTNHFNTIDINTGLPYEEGWVNAVKSLTFQTFLETILQLYGFMANPALRSTFTDNTKLNPKISFVRLFCWKRFMNIFVEMRACAEGMRMTKLRTEKRRFRNRIQPAK